MMKIFDIDLVYALSPGTSHENVIKALVNTDYIVGTGRDGHVGLSRAVRAMSVDEAVAVLRKDVERRIPGLDFRCYWLND